MSTESKTMINGYDFTKALEVTREILDEEKEKELEQIKEDFESFTKRFPLEKRDEYYGSYYHAGHQFNTTALRILAEMYNARYIKNSTGFSNHPMIYFGPQKYITVEKKDAGRKRDRLLDGTDNDDGSINTHNTHHRTDPIMTRSVSAKTSVTPRADNVYARD